MHRNIRSHFRPIQPTIKQADAGITYQELMPAQELRDYIYCYWQLKTTEKLAENYSYNVVADGCIDIFFDLKDRDTGSLMGFCKTYKTFDLGTAFNFVGIRFLPTMFTQIFGIKAEELSEKVSPLVEHLPALAGFVSREMEAEQTLSELAGRLDIHFGSAFGSTNFDWDPRLYNALVQILSSGGSLAIDKEMDVGISARQLQRLFKKFIGTSPKTFSKVVRFQALLGQYQASNNLQGDKYLLGSNYYDQSHFIKDFKKFYGITPERAFVR